MTSIKTIVIGPIYHSLGLNTLQFIQNGRIAVSGNGCIVSAGQNIDDDMFEETSSAQIIKLEEGQFLIPGFVDSMYLFINLAHIHGPQYVFTGTGYDLPLLKWLETYTFPRESAFKDVPYAIDNYTKVVKKSLSFGTTTACYFGTTHLDSTIEFAKIVHKLGQRAFVGKVNMDRNSPTFYSESTKESFDTTELFISKIADLDISNLVTPCITPRFVPSCTPELMTNLAELAEKFNIAIQSHLSETLGELEWVKQLHPDIKDYCSVYDSFGLLTEKTIMAHCIHLSKDERELLKLRKVGISHCASSNFSLGSGVLNLRRLLNEGHEKIGLGTDVAGGYSPSIIDAMRQTLTASKVTQINSGEPSLNFKEVFYLATLGGAQCMGLDRTIGNFVKGKQFDAVIVDMNGIDLFEHDQILSTLQKFVYLGEGRNVKSVFVAGKRIF